MSGKTVTKKELVIRVAEMARMKQSEARDVIQTFIDEITQELASGNRIELRDFGVFEVRTRKSRDARNPKTGEKVKVPPKRVVSIKPGKKMKDIINEAHHAMDQRNSTPMPIQPPSPPTSE